MELQAKRRKLPAWLLSSTLHATCLLLLGFLYEPQGNSIEEPEARPVSIVLAQRDPSPTMHVADSQAASQESIPSVDPATLPSAASAGITLEFNLTSAVKLPSIDIRSVVTPPTQGAGASPRIPSNTDTTALFAEEAERRRRQAAIGPLTNVQLFGSSSAVGRSFVFLIDRSKSMGGQGLGAMRAAEQELLQSLSKLEPSHKFQVIAYHHKCVYLREREMLPATPANLAAIQGHLDSLAAFGATEHEQAIRTALYLEPDALFVLTDGGDPRLTSVQLKNIHKRAKGKTTIHCIQFGFGPQSEETNFLIRLAAQNGGSYGYVDMSKNRSRNGGSSR